MSPTELPAISSSLTVRDESAKCVRKGVPLVFVLIGIPLLIVLGLGSLVLAIIATVKASNGLCYRYPLTLRLVP